MYKPARMRNTTLHVNHSYQGESIEEKIYRITNNKEPISDGAPLIYTPRKEGVKEAYDIRTDRFEVAVEAMDKVTKTHLARREERHKDKTEKDTDKTTQPNEGGKTDKSTPTTESGA